VFHSKPQVQNHLSSLRGDRPHRGQRMRGGSDATGFSSRSGTMTGFSATQADVIINRIVKTLQAADSISRQ
jgi:hypothetical protein